MLSQGVTNSIILRDFQVFYDLLLELRNRAERDDFKPQELTQSGGVILTPAQYVLTSLKSLLEDQYLKTVGYVGGMVAKVYQDAQYLMVALADEVFLNLKWKWREEWEFNLLEAELFNSQVAGERVFQSLDAFLKERDPAVADSAVLYLMVLGLGFQGKYRGSSDLTDLQRYKDRLFTFITHTKQKFGQTDYRLCPQAYVYTLDQAKPRLLPTPKRWMMAVLGVLLIYASLSYMIWSQETNFLRGRVDQLINLLVTKGGM